MAQAGATLISLGRKPGTEGKEKRLHFSSACSSLSYLHVIILCEIYKDRMLGRSFCGGHRSAGTTAE